MTSSQHQWVAIPTCIIKQLTWNLFRFSFGIQQDKKGIQACCRVSITMRMEYFSFLIKSSFESFIDWMKDIREHAPENVLLFFVGYKADLEDRISLDYKEILDFTKNYNSELYIVSAKNCMGIKELVKRIGILYMEKIAKYEN